MECNRPQNLVYELFIRTTPERLWTAITDGSYTKDYFFGTAVQSQLRQGGPIKYMMGEERLAVEGEILEIDAPRLLIHTWKICYNEQLSGETSRVTWLIEARGEATKLTVIHDVHDAPLTCAHTSKDGWSVVLSGLKTLLETGSALIISKP
jgi:uncharacterized protein YndB with AHSA1/START domain